MTLYFMIGFYFQWNRLEENSETVKSFFFPNHELSIFFTKCVSFIMQLKLETWQKFIWKNSFIWNLTKIWHVFLFKFEGLLSLFCPLSNLVLYENCFIHIGHSIISSLDLKWTPILIFTFTEISQFLKLSSLTLAALVVKIDFQTKGQRFFFRIP